MSEETESTPTRKRRVIHWNPDAGKEQQRSRWTFKRIAAWVIGGPVALLLVAVVVVRGTKLVLGPQTFGGAPASAVAAQPESAAVTFANETKSQFAHETAVKGLAQVAKLPQNHPSQLAQRVGREVFAGLQGTGTNAIKRNALHALVHRGELPTPPREVARRIHEWLRQRFAADA